jgi:hypothetical protein
MYRSAIRHGRSTRESLRLAGVLLAAFAVWFGLSAGFTQVEAFHDGPDRPPWLVYLFFALIVIGPIAVARWSSLDELLADRRTLAELLITQTARWLGCVFLVLEVGGQLPGFFAYPAAGSGVFHSGRRVWRPFRRHCAPLPRHGNTMG